MIPDLVDIGGPWKVLPPGIHSAPLEEVRIRYATNEHRKNLFEGFKRGFLVLTSAGCKGIFLDGSFVGEKEMPGDFDVCWLPAGVNSAKLDQVLLDFSNRREAQKRKYGGEFFPLNAQAAPGAFFLDYFQIDKHTGKPKGILRVY